MYIYTRKMLLALIDILLFVISIYVTLLIKFDGRITKEYLEIFLYSAIPIALANVFLCNLLGLYKSIWRYAGIREIVKIAYAQATCSVLLYGYSLIIKPVYPSSFYIIYPFVTIVLISGSRLGVRLTLNAMKNISRNNTLKRRVMVIGAGEAGTMLIRELKSHPELAMVPVAIIDDDRWKQKLEIEGVPVTGNRDKIIEMAQKYKVDEIIIAIPSAGRNVLKEILNICKQTQCRLKTLPGVYEIIDGKVTVNQIRDVNIEDLLGRDEIKLNTKEIAEYLTNEVVLVTGGGGSIGSELCRQIAAFAPKKLIIFDVYENCIHDLQNELSYSFVNELDIEVLVGTIRDKERMRQIFQYYKPAIVFHAAAHKHVPLMEKNPSEAVKNNVIGTLNTAQCADEFAVKKFVLISTDKAVNPTNIMGATKRMCEMIVQSMNAQSSTEFVSVRFGNVLGSNGSVIPLFKKQILNGGPITITDPEVIRYFMTIPEAAALVIQAGAMARGGEIFILDMGSPVKIIDLAKDLIRLSGLEPETDIKLEITGLRPGEKLYEELLMDEEGIEKTGNDKIYVGKPLELSYDEVLLRVKALEKCLGDPVALRECMRRAVPTYKCIYGGMSTAGMK